jgi:CSLREA domain-containing protein
MLPLSSISLVVSAVVVLALADAPAPVAATTTFTVTKTADTNDGSCDADCSLREAVVAANALPGPDTIAVPAGTYTLEGAGNEDLAASGDLDIRDSVTIAGAGAAVTNLDGDEKNTIFHHVESATVTISGLTLQHGRPADGDTQGGGAILWNEPESGKTLHLHLDGVVVSQNSAGDGDGGGILIEQDKPASSTVTITDSTISGNTMDDGDGGGLHLCCENLTVTIDHSTISGNTAVEDPNVFGTNGEGGGIYHCCTDTSLMITDSTIRDNTGPTQGGGIYACCGVANNTLVTLERSTVSGNSALGPGTHQGFGGGIEGEGAVVLVNSTLSGNHARRDGGGIENEDVLVMRNVTIANNDAARGGGFFDDGFGTTLANVLFAGNLVLPSTPSNCGASLFTDPFVSEGGNLSADATCALTGPGDRTSLDPRLEPLADNGGPTFTHALGDGSPAIDGGRDATCQVVDQRGLPRPADGDSDGTAACDVGAVEREAVLDNCQNGVDDNGNGLVDCADLDCAGRSFCPERCDNCVDDDGDGAIDRVDSGCVPNADGAGAGVANPAERGPLVVKCAGAIAKAGAKVAGKRHSALQKCFARLSTCVQRKNADPRCLAKAGAACQKTVADLAELGTKARAGIVKTCTALTTDEIQAAAGLGYTTEGGYCTNLGVAFVGDAPSVAACVAVSEACTVDRLVVAETPRARALAELGGLTLNAVLPCAPGLPPGNGAGLAERGKIVEACQQAIRKAGAKLVAGSAKLAHGCADAVFACRQAKPADAACLAKAGAACAKARGKITALETALATAIDAKCGAAKLAPSELLGTSGAGFQTDAALCKALGVPLLDGASALATCLTRHHECRARQLLDRELPRAGELLETGGIAFP